MINTSDILKTSKARCRDCYRCVRACPVKAIGVKDNQAYIDPDKCILCGTCVRECPQKAKIYRDDIQKGVDELGVDLSEHIQFVIDAMKSQAEALGL